MVDFGWQYLTSADKQAVVAGVRDGVAYGGPYHVEIYPADRCNIDCFFCSTAAIRGTDELPLDRFELLLGEFKAAGTRSIRLAGGGEPLFHRKTKPMLRAIVESGIPLENLTTNAVLIDDETARLLVRCCDQVTVSLNTGEAKSYSEMMQTPARNFDRVIANVERLIAARKQVKESRTRVTLQFLVWRDNYKQIPEMYALARRLDVDNILFGGLAFLRPDQEMSEEQLSEMLHLYEEVVRVDEFRRITTISTFERDISPAVGEMINRLSAERGQRPLHSKLFDFLSRSDQTLADRIRHHYRVKQRARALAETKEFDESCVIGWISMIIRSDGSVGPCCMLQDKKLGNIFQQPLSEIWYGSGYQQFRSELTRIIAQGPAWAAAAGDTTVESICAVKGTNLCPIKSYFFIEDTKFVRDLDRAFAAHRGGIS
ncbi:MAG TPA: radical SAM protein [Thermoanaerobaculia bacterium]|nr:radical SAM protein [Thermoanaerobaculia bacterium]